MPDPKPSRTISVPVSSLKRGQILMDKGRSIGMVERIVTDRSWHYVELLGGGSERYKVDATVEVIDDSNTPDPIIIKTAVYGHCDLCGIMSKAMNEEEVKKWAEQHRLHHNKKETDIPHA